MTGGRVVADSERQEVEASAIMEAETSPARSLSSSRLAGGTLPELRLRFGHPGREANDKLNYVQKITERVSIRIGFPGGCSWR
jgi:hypothetical protein